jgi:TetR/AcrR family transcriptional regulator, transcriptional repressor for nem operon
MPRPREFDRTKALEQAMELFWKQGYEATSMHDLGAHLGLPYLLKAHVFSALQPGS